MKTKITTLVLFLAMAMTAFGQYRESVHVYDSSNMQFRISIPDGSLVLNAQDSTLYYMLKEYSPIDTLGKAIADGYARRVTSGVPAYWSRNGNYIYPSTIGDSVGIGTATPGAKLEVNGDLKLKNNVKADSILTTVNNSDGALVTSGAVKDMFGNYYFTGDYLAGRTAGSGDKPVLWFNNDTIQFNPWDLFQWTKITGNIITFPNLGIISPLSAVTKAYVDSLKFQVDTTLWESGSGTSSVKMKGFSTGGISDNNYTTAVGKLGMSRFLDGTTSGATHIVGYNEADSMTNPVWIRGGLSVDGDTLKGTGLEKITESDLVNIQRLTGTFGGANFLSFNTSYGDIQSDFTVGMSIVAYDSGDKPGTQVTVTVSSIGWDPGGSQTYVQVNESLITAAMDSAEYTTGSSGTGFALIGSDRTNKAQISNNVVDLTYRPDSITETAPDGSVITEQIMQVQSDGTLKELVAGLETVTEGGNTGWRLVGVDSNNYGNTGNNAVNMSVSSLTSSTRGATGDYSFAIGASVTASGARATATGNNTIASGIGAFSTGKLTNASGSYTFTSGYGTTANGDASFATGRNTTANGVRSFVFGNNTYADGNYSIAGGNSYNTSTDYNKATGISSFSFQQVESGFGIIGTGADNSAILGGKNNNIQAAAVNSIILGGNGITADKANTTYIQNLKSNNIHDDGTHVIINNDTMPTLDGTAGQHLKTNGSRLLGWGQNVTTTGSPTFANTVTVNRSAITVPGGFQMNTAGGIYWFAGMADSDIAGDGSEYFIGTSTLPSSAKLWIETTGNVGVGTTSPSKTLDVNGTGRFTGELTADGVVDVNAAVNVSISAIKTANTTLDGTKMVWLFNPAGTGVTATLPAMAGNTGRTYMIVNMSAFAMTVSADGTEKINAGASTFSLSGQTVITIVASGETTLGWFVSSARTY